jgi:hypothetical protein
MLFMDLLQTQLVLKGIVTEEEWQEMKQFINIDYQKDTHFSELKESELLRERLGTLREMDEYVGKYFSAEWLRKNVLMQSEEDIKMIDDQIASEGEENEEPDDDDDLDVEN